MRYGLAGRWWRFVPTGQWPQDEEGLRAIMRHWEEGVGDCRQELVSSVRTWTSRPCAQPRRLPAG